MYSDIAKIPDGYETNIKHNVRAYYNKVISIDDTDIFVTTLWAKILLQDASYTERHISDFHRILYNDDRLTFSDFNREHIRCLNFLKNSLKESSAKHKIVLSHHVPSFKMSAQEFKGSPANGAFTVELYDFICNSDIEYWIFGHSHRNIEAKIGNTQCICNQLGYVNNGEHLTFNKNRHITI